MSQTSYSHIQSRISSGTLALIAVLGQTRDMLVPTDLTWNASPNMTRDVLYGCRTKLESHRVAKDCFLKFLMLNHLDILAHQNLADSLTNQSLLVLELLS